jgi:hypothetical protein
VARGLWFARNGAKIALPCQAEKCREKPCAPRAGTAAPRAEIPVPCREIRVPPRGILIPRHGAGVPPHGTGIPRHGTRVPRREIQIPARGTAVLGRGIWRILREIEGKWAEMAEFAPGSGLTPSHSCCPTARCRCGRGSRRFLPPGSIGVRASGAGPRCA